jgi:hypothetical protein
MVHKELQELGYWIVFYLSVQMKYRVQGIRTLKLLQMHQVCSGAGDLAARQSSGT